MIGILLFIHSIHAQQRTAVVQLQTDLNKYLLQNTIAGICSDSLGGIWAATQFGILHSDGTDTRLIHTGNDTSIKSNRFNGIYYLPEAGFHIAVNTAMQMFRLGKSGRMYPYKIRNDERLITHSNRAFLINQHEWNLPASLQPIIPVDLYHYDRKLCGFYVLDTWYGVPAAGGRKNKYYIKQTKGDNTFVRDDNELFFYVHGVLKYHNTMLQGYEDVICLEDSLIVVRQKSGLYFFNLNSGMLQITGSLEPLRIGEAIVIFPVDHTTYYLGTYNYGIAELNLMPVEVLNGPIPSIHKNLYIYSYARTLDSVFLTTYEGLIRLSHSIKNSAKLWSSPVSSSSLLVDDEQRVWTSMNRDVGYFNMRTNKFISFGQVPYTPHVFFKHQGALYFTVYEHLYRIEPESKQLVYLKQYNETRRFYGIRHMGNKTFLLSDHGLIQLDHNLNAVAQKYQGYIIRDVVETPQGMYVATYGDGLHLLKADGTGKRIFQDRFGWSSAALSMRYDSLRKRLWLVCNKGIFILGLNKNGLPGPAQHLLACGSELPCTELNGGDYEVRPEDLYYYFPSNNGLMKVPINWNTGKTSQEYLLKGVVSNGKNIHISDQIYLPAAHRNIIFKLLLPFSFHEENEEQEYRLLPLFQNWRPIPENRQLLFSQLPHGSYTLWIRNANGERRITTIHVARFWFQEPLFHLSVVLLLVGVIVLLISLRTRTLRNRSAALERAVAQKTEALNINLKQLEASQKQVADETAIRENMNSVLLHDIRSPLLFLTQSSYNLNNKLKLRYPELFDAANVLAGTVKDLYILSSDYITWLKNRKSGLGPEPEILSLNHLIEETLSFYRPIISTANNNINYHCAPEDQRRMFCTDGQLLRCVLRNLIDNSNKFTKNGSIRVELNHEPGCAIVTVHDNGDGLPARILTTYARRSKDKPNLWTLKAMQSEEIGMNMILQFTEMIQGVITYERQSDETSKFRLILTELQRQESSEDESLKSMP